MLIRGFESAGRALTGDTETCRIVPGVDVAGPSFWIGVLLQLEFSGERRHRTSFEAPCLAQATDGGGERSRPIDGRKRLSSPRGIDEHHSVVLEPLPRVSALGASAFRSRHGCDQRRGRLVHRGHVARQHEHSVGRGICEFEHARHPLTDRGRRAPEYRLLTGGDHWAVGSGRRWPVARPDHDDAPASDRLRRSHRPIPQGFPPPDQLCLGHAAQAGRPSAREDDRVEQHGASIRRSPETEDLPGHPADRLSTARVR